MGDKISLKVDARSVQGKKVARLRQQGFVPGVVYGQGFDPILVQSEYNVIEKVVREAGKHSPVQLTVDGKQRIALIKDIDRSPVKGQIRHVSFHAVKANELVTAEVPVRLVGIGESPAEKAGLVILQAIESVEIKAKPADLVDALEVSVENLKSDSDKLLLSDIVLPAEVHFADAELDLELVVANVYEPAALEAANEAAAGDAEEPIATEAVEVADTASADEATTDKQ